MAKFNFNPVIFALNISLGTNVVIVGLMLYVALASGSLAMLSTLIENITDLAVQGMLWWAGSTARKADYAKYPAGKSRYEPVSVIIASSLMGIGAVIIIKESVMRLIDGIVHKEYADLDLPYIAFFVIGFAVTIKIILSLYCYRVAKKFKSSTVMATSIDHRNDVMSNTLAITAFALTYYFHSLWWLDAGGAIVIFIYIAAEWFSTAREQVRQLVGISAGSEFVEELKDLASHHHPSLSPDIIRAYHFGNKYLVEMEVILPADMTVRVAHDIALQLQFKLEQLDDVERAFVHVDYRTRDYDEHVVSREEDALLRYASSDSTVIEDGRSSLAQEEDSEDQAMRGIRKSVHSGTRPALLYVSPMDEVVIAVDAEHNPTRTPGTSYVDVKV